MDYAVLGKRLSEQENKFIGRGFYALQFIFNSLESREYANIFASKLFNIALVRDVGDCL